MLADGKGYYEGSSIPVSGTAGTGKTSFAAHFIDAACRRGERCLYFAFEESPSQIGRNMSSIGIDFSPWTNAGLLQIHSSRPMAHGLEMHLMMRRAIDDFEPKVVIIDPITNLTNVGTESDVKFTLTRLVDYLKTRGITTLCTSLMDSEEDGQAAHGISSLMDTWIRLRMFENGNERNRGVSVVRSRGLAHLHGRYKIEVINLLDEPQLAKGDQILAIPTLVRQPPPPLKKIIGDLSDTERVLVGLDLRPAGYVLMTEQKDSWPSQLGQEFPISSFLFSNRYLNASVSLLHKLTNWCNSMISI